MRNFLLTLAWTSLLFCSQLSSWAQYQPDTSLSFTRFLRECQEFSRSESDQLWVVTFWASHNSASLYEVSELKTLSNQYRSKPMRFIGISVDKNRNSWERAIMQFRLPWEHLFLPSQDEYNFLRRAFKHRSYPATFIVYPSGRIRRVVNLSELRRELAREAMSLPSGEFTPSPDPILEPFEPNEPPTTLEPPRSEDNLILITIRKGDTLFSIARRYGISVDELKRINSLRGDRIRAGDQLRVPSP